ncbi:MAG: ATP-binding protein [Deltaproteobacteria bacterium]|nr:ATP-binding protein [Deltaproteobacteria bacterium]
MPHLRQRQASGLIKKALTYSPVVGILGMRQVGKSTLMKEQVKIYYTFDDESFQIRFQSEGRSILDASRESIGLDEVQKYPPVFDLIKTLVDQKKKPGRFCLTGSIRFSSKKQIRESLTGRIVSFDLFPLTLSECHSKPFSTFLKNLCSDSIQKISENFSQKNWAQEGQLLHYFQSGGLPGICFRREANIRNELYRAHLETLLARDIHFIKKTTLPYLKLFRLMEELAKREGLSTNISELSKVVGTSPPTLSSILNALEALFLIRPYGSTYYIEDAGISFFLQNNSKNSMTRLDRTKLIYLELRSQLHYLLRNEATFQPYQTRGGVDIPFFIKYRSGRQIAICVDETDYPTDKSLKSLLWTQKKFPDLLGLVAHAGKKFFRTNSGILCVPWVSIF